MCAIFLFSALCILFDYIVAALGIYLYTRAHIIYARNTYGKKKRTRLCVYGRGKAAQGYLACVVTIYVYIGTLITWSYICKVKGSRELCARWNLCIYNLYIRQTHRRRVMSTKARHRHTTHIIKWMMLYIVYEWTPLIWPTSVYSAPV